MAKSTPAILCPSAQPDTPEARVFAVIGGTVAEPEAAYLDEALPVTEEVLAMAGPVSPAEVFRFAAPCAASVCQHFDGQASACTLAAKTVKLADTVVQTLPRCAIRRDCRWWQQEGMVACQRCPQVVTVDAARSGAMLRAADPSNREAGRA
jgi:hypothetical protein